MLRDRRRFGRAEAEALAIQALAFLAEDERRLARFLGLTGIEIGTLRAEAGSPPVLIAVLEHLLGDESLLLVFTAQAGAPPELVAQSRQLLAEPCRPREWRR